MSTSEQPAVAPEPPAAPTPKRSPIPWVVAAIAVLLAVVAGVIAYQARGEDPELTATRERLAGTVADLEQARGDLATAQQKIAGLTEDQGSSSSTITQLRRQLTRLKQNTIATDDLPVVIYEPSGLATPALRAEFQTKLLDPYLAHPEFWGSQPLVFVISIPSEDGQDYSYSVYFADGGYEGALFGQAGSPLPTWQPPTDGVGSD